MKTKRLIILSIILTLFISCDSKVVFNSFQPINHIELLGNTSRLDSIYFDSDSNIISTLKKDTFQINLDIDKTNKHALIFSLGKIDTVGNLSFKKQAVYFRPKNDTNTYKMFDFNAKTNDSWTIKHCGPLTNSILNVENTKNNGNEIIQQIRVINKPQNPPNIVTTKIKRFIVSSKYGIKEMDIYIGWADSEIKIKNAP